MTRQKKTIIYVNFSPYENTGKILDYLLEYFENVIVFIFNFHHLGKAQKSGEVRLYKNGVLEKKEDLLDIPFHVSTSLIFLLIPIRSFINFLQLLWHLIRLRRHYTRFELYFTVNAFTAWVGIFMKRLGLVKNTIFWVWDYYPPYHQNKIILFMRRLYWYFDRASLASDHVVFLNKRLEDLRKDMKVLPQTAFYPIVPIGTDPIQKIPKKKIRNGKIILGFLGVLRKAQGIDIFFDNAEKIHSLFPGIRLEIVGAGPDERYFKELAKQCPIPTTFFGYIPNENKIREIQLKWHIGIAPYIPEESSVSYYTDQGKIKGYISLGLPVIITGVQFSKEIVKEKAGVVIDYNKPHEFVQAIVKIAYDYENYQRSALRLAKKYYYKKNYQELFSF